MSNLIDRLMAGTPKDNRLPFPRLGAHVFAIESMSLFPSKDKGEAVKVILVTVESNNPAEHPIGSRAETNFFVNEPGPWQAKSRIDDCIGFVKSALCEVVEGTPQAITAYMLGAEGLVVQPAKGYLIRCHGKPHKRGDGSMTSYSDWLPFEGQTKEGAAAMRQRIETGDLAAPAAPVAPQAVPAVTDATVGFAPTVPSIPPPAAPPAAPVFPGVKF